MAESAQRVLAVTSSPACSASDVARAVSQDQALSLRVMRLANSSAYSRGSPVTDMRQAIACIGVREVHHLVLTLSVVEQYQAAATPRLDRHRFWEHSIACGLLAAAIGRSNGAQHPDSFFLYGMLHDVGRLVLAEHAADAYRSVWERSDEFRLPLEVVEPRVVSLAHTEVLRRALEFWKFPFDLTVAVTNHHQSAQTIRSLGPRYA